MQGRGTIGVQNSQKCRDVIGKFYECQKNFGIWRKVGGACLEARDEMDQCLYAEYVERRTENLRASQERMARYARLNSGEEYKARLPGEQDRP